MRILEKPAEAGSTAPRLAGSLSSIQALRFFAAFVVVIYHAHGNLFGFDANSPTDTLFGVGQAGVHVFFVISGFIMVYTVAQLKDGEYSASMFLQRRFVRVYPIYWLCAILYLVFHGLYGEGYRIDGPQTVASLLLLPEYSSAIIGPGWTLSYEIYFYICFSLFMRLGSFRGLIAMSAFFITSIAAGFLIGDGAGAFVQLATNVLLLEFLAGSWIAFVLLNVRIPSLGLGVAMIAASLAGFLLSVLVDYNNYPLIVMWGLPSMALVMGIVTIEARRALPKPIASTAFLGDSSYLLYLSHILIIDMLLASGLQKTGYGFVDLWIMPAGIALFCCAAAAWLHPAVERPLVSSVNKAVAGLRSARSGARVRL